MTLGTDLNAIYEVESQAPVRGPCSGTRIHVQILIYSGRMKFIYPAFLSLALTAFAASGQTQNEPMHDTATKMEKAPVPASKSINVNFEGRLTTLTVRDLLNLPQVTVHVHNGHSNTDESYTGPLVSDVLARAGLKPSRETHPLMLHSSLIATGTDHYFVVYSIAEVEPMFSSGQAIVAVMKGDLPNTDGGMIELINTADKVPARWMHGLADLNVVSVAATK